jgi:hypothetical protein
LRSTLLLLWFAASRWATYLSLCGIWIFSGLFCLVGGPGRPSPPDAYALLWLLGTIAAVPLVLVYTRYNLKVLVRLTARAAQDAGSLIKSEWDKA